MIRLEELVSCCCCTRRLKTPFIHACLCSWAWTCGHQIDAWPLVLHDASSTQGREIQKDTKRLGRTARQIQNRDRRHCCRWQGLGSFANRRYQFLLGGIGRYDNQWSEHHLHARWSWFHSESGVLHWTCLPHAWFRYLGAWWQEQSWSAWIELFVYWYGLLCSESYQWRQFVWCSWQCLFRKYLLVWI